MTADPTPKQTLILWALLGHGGADAQSALGLPVDKKDRDALAVAGLVTVAKGKRGALRIEVTDQGWEWANRNLDAALPSGRNATKAGTAVLQTWLGRLRGYLTASGIPLAEILFPAEPLDIAKPPDPDEREVSRTALDYTELRQRVRNAYRQLTGVGFSDSVTLSRLRRALSDLERQRFDAVVTRMHDEDGGTTLMPIGNPREIEPERDSAIRLKGQDMHVLWITR